MTALYIALMQYFIKIGEWKTGPFDYRGISQLLINKETLIWYEGLHDWTKAEELLEMLDLVHEKKDSTQKPVTELLKEMGIDVTVPHPENQLAFKNSNNARILGVTIIAALIISAAYLLEYYPL